MQNPRRLCHVYYTLYRPIAKIIYTYILYTGQYAYADKCVSVRGSIRKFGKDKALSSSSLLPTLRGTA